jgi:hypothetical protein
MAGIHGVYQSTLRFGVDDLDKVSSVFIPSFHLPRMVDLSEAT